jgi:hypothetical protein
MAIVGLPPRTVIAGILRSSTPSAKWAKPLQLQTYSPNTLPAPLTHVFRISETHLDFAPLQVNCVSYDLL